MDNTSSSSSAPAPENSESVSTAPVADAVVAKATSMIVVLAKNASAVRATVSFLERRGMPARIVGSLNEAVELFSKKEANKLLLSVNFPHPKVEMLPVLMNQSFQIETILYAEESDRKSSSRLSNAKTKHVLFGPVSGPVVMMKIRQIDRELNGENDDASGSASSRVASGGQDEGDIKVGGRKGTTDDTVVLNGKAMADKKAVVDNLMKSLNDDDQSTDGSSLQRSGETYVQKGERSKMKSETQEGLDDSSGGTLSERAQDLRRGIDRGLEAAPAEGRSRLIMPNSFRKPRPERSHEASQDAEKADHSSPEHEKALAAARARAESEAAEAAKKAEREAASAKQKQEREALAAKQRSEREAGAAQAKAEREAAAAAREKLAHEAAVAQAKTDRESAAAAKAKSDADKAKEAVTREAKAANTKDQPSEKKADPLAAAPTAAADKETKRPDPQTEKPAQKEAPAGASIRHDPIGAKGATAKADTGGKSLGEMTAAEKRALNLEDKIQLCLRESLAIVAGAPTEAVQQLSLHNQAALVSLRSASLECSFVVSLSRARQAPAELFQRMEIAFFSLLRDYEIEFENRETYSILLDDMSIVRRAFETSEYVVVTRTIEIEMGVAKVFANNPVASIEPYEENMVSVNLRDVPVDVPVTFSLFLHLKRNRKYVRYLKKGSSMSRTQVERLEKQNAHGLVDQEEVEAYRRHYAAHAIQAPKRSAA